MNQSRVRAKNLLLFGFAMLYGAWPYMIMGHGLVLTGFAAPSTKPREASTAAECETAIEVNKSLSTGLAFQGQDLLSLNPNQSSKEYRK